MKLKKINALAGLVATLLLLCHAGTMTLSLYTGWYNYPVCKTFAKLIFLFVAVHIICSLIILFFYHDGSETGLYKKANTRLILQRASAILMMLLIHTHTKAYKHMATGTTLTTGQSLFFLIFEILFLCTVMLHVSMSFSKALITLGILSSPAKAGVLDKIILILCILLAIASCGGVASFFLGGIM